MRWNRPPLKMFLNSNPNTKIKSMKFAFFTLMLCLLPFLATAQTPEKDLQIEIPSGPKPWTSLDFNNDEDQFQFAIVTDRTGGHRPGVFLKGIQKLNLLQPEFVMSVGDMIEGYTEDTVELQRQWEEFNGFIDQLQMPFFYVPGNHDITNKVMEDVWKQRYGQTNYYFIYKDVLFIAANSEDQYRGSSRGSISDEQYEWLKSVLAQHPDVRWTFLFMHQPLWLQETDPVRWFDVEKLLADRKHAVFVGHRHRYTKFERNNNNYYMLATTGGSSPLRGPELGEFDHVVWVTMTKEGPILANLQLEGIWDDALVTEDIADEITAINRARPFKIEPIYFEGKTFKNGIAKIRITNDADVPLLVKLNNSFSWGYKSALSKDEVEVAPNSVEFVDLEIEPRKMNASSDHPVGLSATISYQNEDSKAKIAIPVKYKVAPEPKYIIKSTNKTIKIDGQLNEWKELPYMIDTKEEDSGNLSGKFGITYDDQYVYVAGQIMDDDLFVNAEDVTWRLDYAGFILDAAPMSTSVMRTGSGWYNESFISIMSPETDKVKSTTFYEERQPEGVEVICKAIDGGYIIEGAVPISYIEAQQGKNWQTLRVNFIIQDRDKGDHSFDIYSWQPDWRGNDNRLGSGMFFRK